MSPEVSVWLGACAGPISTADTYSDPHHQKVCGELHTWQTVQLHTFVHSSHRTARADGVLSQSFHGHSHTLTLHGRTQHMVTSAPV